MDEAVDHHGLAAGDHGLGVRADGWRDSDGALEAQGAVRAALGHDGNLPSTPCPCLQRVPLRPSASELDAAMVRFGRHVVLGGVSLVIDDGAYVCVRGANGAGKTTLLRLLAGAIRPSRGSRSRTARRVRTSRRRSHHRR